MTEPNFYNMLNVVPSQNYHCGEHMADMFISITRDGQKVALNIDCDDWEDTLMDQWRCHRLINQLAKEYDRVKNTPAEPQAIPVTVNVNIQTSDEGANL